MRKLIKTLLTGCLLLPTLGFAMGLGDIHLHSNLNQQLNAEIDLLSVDPSEVNKITASLASYDTFSKLGVDRPSVLMLLQFDVEKRPDGTPFIKIKSKEPIDEPFLDFLVEVTWPTGKVLREYTLLLDPPSMSAQQEPVLVEAPRVEETPTPKAKPAQPVEEPVVSAPVDMEAQPATQEAQAPQAGEEQQPAQEQQAGEPQVAQAPQAAQPAAGKTAATQPAASSVTPPEKGTPQPVTKKAPLVSPAPSANLVYGPVKRNETLSRIASTMRPDDSVTVDQMMIALYNSNREAFIHNNINLLRKGAVLRVEDPATLKALSKAEASREVARQGRAWEEYRSQVAAHTPKRVPKEAAAKESVKAGVAVAPAKEESKLTLVAPSKGAESKQPKVGGTSEKGGDVESLHKELLLANETAEARRKENEELNKRLKELQGQLEQMQKLLTLKDDNLAAMQQRLAEQQKGGAAAKVAPGGAKPAQPATATPPAPVQSATPVQPLAAPVQPADPAKSATPPSPQQPPLVAPPKDPEPQVKAPEAAPASGAVSSPAVADAGKPTTPLEESAPVQNGANTPETVKPAGVTTPKPTAPKKPRHFVPPPPPPDPTLVDQLLENPVMLAGAAGAIILLLGLTVALRRRRQGRGFQESILTVGTTSSMMKGKGDHPASETSFLSDLAISGMGGRVQEESDVDPLTEADVYMAYNRFPQAEELLKEALKHHPEREELHAKLLEVYYKSQNRAEFEKVAEARSATMQRNQSLWQKVVAMGHELAPQNPLFMAAAAAGGAALLAGSGAPPAPATNEIFDIGLDLDALSNEMEAAGSGGSDFVDLGLDFSDFDLDGDAKKKSEEPVASASDTDFNFELGGAPEAQAEPEAESPSFDFDLDSFGGGSDSSAAETTALAEESSLGGLDFDFTSMAEETPAGEEPATALDFGDFSIGEETSAVEEEPAASLDFGDFSIGEEASAVEEPATSLDFGDFSIEEETPAAEEPASSMDFGDFDLGSMAEETPAAEPEHTFDFTSLDLGDTDNDPAVGSSSVDFGDLDLGGGAEESAMDLADLGDFGDLGDLGGGAFGDMDEVGTKLDLAKAYADMGDAEGARGMLEEVMQEGSADQKRQAEELLSQIA